MSIIKIPSADTFRMLQGQIPRSVPSGTYFFTRAQLKTQWLMSNSQRAHENLYAWISDIMFLIDEHAILGAYAREQFNSIMSAPFNDKYGFRADIMAGYICSSVFVALLDVHYGQPAGPEKAERLAKLLFEEVTPGFLKLDMRGPEIVKLTPYTPFDCSFF